MDHTSQGESLELARMRADIGNAAYEQVSLGIFEDATSTTSASPQAPEKKTAAGKKAATFMNDLGKMFQDAVFDDSDSRAVQGLTTGKYDYLHIKSSQARALSATYCHSQIGATSTGKTQKPVNKKTNALNPQPGATTPEIFKLAVSENLLYQKPGAAVGQIPAPRPALTVRDHNEGQAGTQVKDDSVVDGSTVSTENSATQTLPFLTYSSRAILSLRHVPIHSVGSLVLRMPPSVSAELRPVRYTFNEFLAARLIKHSIPRPSTLELLRQAMDGRLHVKHQLDAPIDNCSSLGSVQKRSSGVHYSSNFDPIEDYGSKLIQDRDLMHYFEESKQIQEALIHASISDSPKYNVKRHRIVFSHEVNMVVRDTEGSYYAVLECVERYNGIVYRNLFIRQVNRIMYIDVLLIQPRMDHTGDKDVRIWFRGRSSQIPNNRSPQSIHLRFCNAEWRNAFVKCILRLRDPAANLFPDTCTVTPQHEILVIQTRDFYANPVEHRSRLEIIMDEFGREKSQDKPDDAISSDVKTIEAAIPLMQEIKWDWPEVASHPPCEVNEDLIDLGDQTENTAASQKKPFNGKVDGSSRQRALTKCEMDWITEFGASGIKKSKDAEGDEREMKISELMVSIDMDGLEC